MFQSLKAQWKAKQGAWLRTRIASGSHTLGKRSVFILPTRQGVYVAFFLLAMLLACINYNLSLGYMLTFFVFSVSLGAMHRTHQNLLGTRIEVLPVDAVFAGETVKLPMTIENPSTLVKHTLLIAQRGDKTALRTVQCSLPSKAQATPSLSLAPLRRGIHRLPALEISSRYPLGLWRAWSYVFPVGTVTVYPEPQSPLPNLLELPQQHSSAAVHISSTRDTQGDAVSHIENVTCAMARSIHWPALAKGQLAQRILDNDSPITQGVLLSFAGCTVVGIEAQLSQLCLAVAHCETNGVPFVMHLSGVNYPSSEQASSSPAHVQQCLQALAAYE
jgi:hypothetical protein